MKRIIATLTSVLLSIPLAAAAVTEWTGRAVGTYTIDGAGNIVILANGTFKFQSVSGGGDLEGIGTITIDDSVTGTVTLYIERSTDNNSPGATNVGSINLTNANATPVIGNLRELRITGNLGTTGPIVVRDIDGDVSVTGDIINAINVTNSLGGAITADEVGDISVGGDWTRNLTATTVGNITVGDDMGNVNIIANTVGNITAGGYWAGNSSLTVVSAGNITIGNTYDADITINGPYSGTATISGDAGGHVVITGELTGDLMFQEDFTGTITIGTDLVPANLAVPGSITIGDVAGGEEVPVIHIKGSITGTGATAPIIRVGDGSGSSSTEKLRNTIAINGCLADVWTGANHPEIQIDNDFGPYPASGTATNQGAIAIDYNGDDPNDDSCWAAGATIKVANTEYARNSGNSNTIRVWNVQNCVGEFDGDGDVTPADATAYSLWKSAPTGAGSYEYTYAGLEGSANKHANATFDSTTDPLTMFDDTRVNNLIAKGCACLTSEPDGYCGGDINDDFITNLTDLAVLLANFGTPSGATRVTGDLDANGTVDLVDLASLLSDYGQPCCPPGTSIVPSGTVSVAVTALNTGSYSGGGFKGEVAHFVFDAFFTLSNSGDDWLTAGAACTVSNGAVLYVISSPGDPPVPGSSLPDKYHSFFSVPYGVNASSRFTNPFPTGGIVGKYSPVGATYIYSSSELNANWWDLNSASNDGPAAVMRITFDVDGVTGADTSSGFGSVYFSTTGPASGSDIEIADFTFKVSHVYTDSGGSTVTGSFYVKG